MTKSRAFKAVYDEHLLTIEVYENGPIQLRLQPVGIERIDGIDLTEHQASMIAAVLQQAVDLKKGELLQ